MADILLEVRDFKESFAGLNGSYRLPVSLRTYLRAAITVGFRSGVDARKSPRLIRRLRLDHGVALFRFFFDLKGGLGVNPAYHIIESSEKAGLTFRHATIFTKIVAEKHLRIPWLANVDEMRKNGVVTINEASRERGDYVGLDVGHDWHAIEAKGRSDGVSPGLIVDAKEQAKRIEKVNGVEPVTRSACVTDLGAGVVKVILADPPRGPNSRKVLQIPTEAFARHYYGNLVDFIRRSGRAVQVSGLPEYAWAPVRAVDLPLPPDIRESDLHLGLPYWLLDHPERALERTESNFLKPSPYAGLDHIALAGRMPDWKGR